MLFYIRIQIVQNYGKNPNPQNKNHFFWFIIYF